MNQRFEDAATTVRQRRAALQASIAALRRRAAPAELAEDLLAKLDPQRSCLQRLRQRIAENRLLSLAILAGAAWLAGATRQSDGKPPATGKPVRVKPKEKNNDSGQQQRSDRHGPGGRRRKATRPEDGQEALRLAEFGYEAWPHDGVTPTFGEPQRFRSGQRGAWPLAPAQQHEF